jgi:Fuc2NAc and GlcNAc transferase
MNPGLLVFVLPVALVSSFVLTGFVRRFALRSRLLDLPNDRSSHTSPTPRGGGLALVIVFLAAVLVLFASGVLDGAATAAILGGGSAVAAVGFWDDYRSLSVRWRLSTHFLAAGWALWCLGGVPPLKLCGHSWDWGYLDPIAGVLALVWLANLFNFMDGIDGIAASEAIFVSVFGGAMCLLIGGSGHALAWWALAAAAGGFLAWNWPPAAIFMGDVGSGFLGFVLGVLILACVRDGGFAPLIWLTLTGVFAVDATLTLACRALRGERVYEPHRTHAYQHAAQRWGHQRVTAAVVLINVLWLGPCAIAGAIWPGADGVTTAAGLLPLVGLAFSLRAGRRSVAPKLRTIPEGEGRFEAIPPPSADAPPFTNAHW